MNITNQLMDILRAFIDRTFFKKTNLTCIYYTLKNNLVIKQHIILVQAEGASKISGCNNVIEWQMF